MSDSRFLHFCWIISNPSWCANLVNWFRLLAIPVNVRIMLISSVENLLVTFAVLAAWRTQSLNFTPAFFAFSEITYRSVLLSLTRIPLSFFIVFIGLPPLAFAILTGVSIVFIGSLKCFCDHREQKASSFSHQRKRFLCNKNTNLLPHVG